MWTAVSTTVRYAHGEPQWHRCLEGNHCLLIGPKASTRGNICLALEIWSRTHSWGSHRCQGVKQLLLFCWTGIVKKCPANSYISTHIFVQISDLSWEVSLCSRGGVNMDRHWWLVTVQRSVCGELSDKWDVFLSHFLCKAQGPRKKGLKDGKSQRSGWWEWWEWNGVLWICQDHWTHERSRSVACARPRQATLQHGARSGPWASTPSLGTGDSGRFGEERGSLL